MSGIDDVLVGAGKGYAIIVYRESCGEVACVCAQVGGDTVEFKVEILSGRRIKILTCDLNAFDGYGQTYIVDKRLTVCKHFCNVKSGNIMLTVTNNLCDAAFDFLHTGVRRYGAGNVNNHTKLNAEIGNGVLSQAVAVITALDLSLGKHHIAKNPPIILQIYLAESYHLNNNHNHS